MTVTVGAHSYRTTVARMGGQFLVPLSAENRAAAGVAAALDADPAVRSRFDALPLTHRNEHVRSVEDAKAEATRLRRIEKVVAALRQDRARRAGWKP